MASVISVLAKVSADASNFVSGIKTAQTTVDKFGRAVNVTTTTSAKDFDAGATQMGNSAIKLGGILATAAKGFLLFQGFNFLKDAVASASAFEAEFEGVNQAFGDGAALVQEFAKNAAATAGVAEVPALRAAKSFGVFATSAGLAGEEAGKFATGLVQAAGDLGSFYDLPTEQALSAISSGLRGETEPLRRFNILIGEAEMNTKAMAMGLGENAAALTQQEKVLVRQQLIMDGLGVAQGDFVKYQDTYGNSIKTVGALMQNLSADVGSALLPVLAKLAGALVPIIEQLGPLLTKVFEALVPIIQVVVDNLGSLMPVLDPIVAILAIFAESFAGIIEALLPSLIEILTMIAPHLEVFAELFAVIVEKVLPPLVKLLEEVFIPILQFLLDIMLTVGIPVITALADVMGNVLTVAVDSLVAGFQWLTETIRPLWEAMKPLVEGFLSLMGIRPVRLSVTSNATLPWWASSAKKPSSADFSFAMPTASGSAGISGMGGGVAAKIAEDVKKTENLVNREGQLLDKRLENLESFTQSVVDLFKSIKEGILGAFDLPSLGSSVNSISRNIKKLLASTKSFAKNITTLSGLGLNDTLLKQIIDQGPVAGARLAQSLVSGGAAFVNELNNAYGEFGNLAGQIATTGIESAYSGQQTVNNFNINVNGGVGSGPTIGKAIVDAIKSYERTSGAVWQGA